MATLEARVQAALTQVGDDIQELRSRAGALASLTTTDKSSLVAAINEIKAGGGGGGATTLDGLTDAVVSSHAAGRLLQADGTNFVDVAGQKASAWVANSTPAGTDEFLTLQGGVNKRTTLAQINSYTEPARQMILATQLLSSAADTYVTGSGMILPQSRMQAGVLARWLLGVSKGAAGTGAPTFTVRLGTNGTTADASVVALTGIAQTAVADTGLLEITALFRTHSSTATIYVNGRFLHALAATGFMTQAGWGAGGLSGSLNTTTANVRIGLSINSGTAAQWSVQAGECQLENIL